MNRHVICFACLVLALGVDGCSQPEKGRGPAASSSENWSPRPDPPSTPSPAVNPLPYRAESNDGTYFVTYQPHPDPIPLNEPFELEVVVFRDADLRKVAKDITLDVDAAMPQHQHGMNQEPSVEATDGGGFRAKNMLFHMSGYWELYFDVTEGPVTERAQFMIQLD